MYSKLPGVGTTIFTRMSQLAAQCGALNLSQGFPDFDGPDALCEALARHVRGHNQYAPMTGIPELREQIAAQIQRVHGLSPCSESEITVTPGATEAIFCAIQAVVHPGDEVIVFDPSYDSYAPAVTLAGGRCVHVPLVPPRFDVDWDAVRAALSPRTRLVILNTPHNPSGAVFSATDWQNLAECLRDSPAYVLSDEVYEHLVFDGQPPRTLLSIPELAAKAFVVASFGKTFHVTGWKIGYVVAPAALTHELRKVHQFVTFCTASPLQYALAEFMAAHPHHVTTLADFYQAKRDRLCAGLSGSAWSFTPTAGTYFQLVNYSALRPEWSDVHMAEWLTREQGVAVIPISVFYANPPADLRYVRLCFAKRDETLDAAVERLCSL